MLEVFRVLKASKLEVFNALRAFSCEVEALSRPAKPIEQRHLDTYYCRALKTSKLEVFGAIKASNSKDFRAQKPSYLAVGDCLCNLSLLSFFIKLCAFGTSWILLAQFPTNHSNIKVYFWSYSTDKTIPTLITR